jgi:hypothetical protein
MQHFRGNLHRESSVRLLLMPVLASGRDGEEDRQCNVQNETGRNTHPGKSQTNQVRDRSHGILPGNGVGRFMGRGIQQSGADAHGARAR